MSDLSRLLRTLRDIQQLNAKLHDVSWQLEETQRRVAALTEQREHLLDQLQMAIQAHAPAAGEAIDALQSGALNVAAVTE